MVVPGTPRDSLFILDTLLNLDAGVKPEMVATDNASYSDMVFGLFKILGYSFSPRFRDLADQRFWSAHLPGAAPASYGPLDAIARNRVNLGKVVTHWPDMTRVAGSLVTGQVRAYDLLRMFGREGRPTPLGQAFAEYGRIAKTLHLLAVVDPVDDTYRRSMNRQLTVQESRHTLARTICHGRRGRLHQPYREGQEDQLGVLGLVLNAVGPVELALSRRRRRPAPGGRARHRRRGRRPPVPAEGEAPEHPGPLRLQPVAARRRAATAERPAEQG